MRPAVAALGAPERAGIDRLAGLTDGPVIFAPNHHSHLDTPDVLTSIPEPWRHKVFVAAAADYFFKTHVTSAASALGARRHPDGAIEGQPPHGRPGRRADRRRLVDAHLPGGRPLPRRLGPAVPRRRRLPLQPVRRAGGARAPRGHRPILRKGAKRPTPAHVRVTFGTPLRPGDGESTNRYAERIERAVAELADEATTDWWQSRRRAAGGHHARRSPDPTRRRGGAPGRSATAPASAAARPATGRSSRRSLGRRVRPGGSCMTTGDRHRRCRPRCRICPPWEATILAQVARPIPLPGYCSSALQPGEHAEHLLALRRLHPDAVVG